MSFFHLLHSKKFFTIKYLYVVGRNLIMKTSILNISVAFHSLSIPISTLLHGGSLYMLMDSLVGMSKLNAPIPASNHLMALSDFWVHTPRAAASSELENGSGCSFQAWIMVQTGVRSLRTCSWLQRLKQSTVKVGPEEALENMGSRGEAAVFWVSGQHSVKIIQDLDQYFRYYSSILLLIQK